jgi:hypothetical protein
MGGMNMRRVAAGLLCSILVLFVGPAALAGKPTMQRSPINDEFVDSSCGFDVDVVTTGFVIDIQWTDSSGGVRDFQAYPQAKQVLTNLETGKTITLNISGPSHVSVPAEGTPTLVGTGHWVWGSNPATGEPGIFMTTGRFVLDLDSGAFSSHGRMVGLCPALAA